MKLEEVIPVGLVTARRFPMVARQVRALWEEPGGGQTPLVMLVDGENEEGEALAGLLNITIVTHNNPGIIGMHKRTNMHTDTDKQTDKQQLTKSPLSTFLLLLLISSSLSF